MKSSYHLKEDCFEQEFRFLEEWSKGAKEFVREVPL